MSLRCCQLLLLVAMASAYYYGRDERRELADYLDQPAQDYQDYDQGKFFRNIFNSYCCLSFSNGILNQNVSSNEHSISILVERPIVYVQVKS